MVAVARLVLLLSLVWYGTAWAEAALEEQRKQFADAYTLLKDGKRVSDLEAIERKLVGYPLAPYLRYQHLNQNLSRASAAQIEAFMDEHGDLPVAGLLATRWLHLQGRRADWAAFRQADAGQPGAALECYRLRAERHASGVDDAWLDRARVLWTVGHSQPDACDPVFAELYQRHALSAERRWERIRLIMLSGNTNLARALEPRLESNEKRWLQYWLAVAANPERALRRPAFDVSSERGQLLVRDGFRRLGVSDQDAAMALLDRYRDQQWLSFEVVSELRRHVALRAAFSRRPEALSWLESLPEDAVDNQVREWAARMALSRQEWQRLVGAIWALPDDMQAQSEWRYWKAYALARTGDEDQARELLQELAGERHYYGFLAADWLGQDYAMNHQPGPRDEARMAELERRPALARAREFHLLGFAEEARREWQAGLAGADAGDWAQAAQLARDWGWYDRMINAANRAGLHDALELRFPLAFRETMANRARDSDVDMGLVYALMRKESAFTPDARSPVGAMGLMQVMPGTGRNVASRLGISGFTTSKLYEPDMNLALGAAYLDQMLKRFDGNLVMAAAAYNAGPGRVDGWRRDNAGLPAQVWVENITFGETRDYVKSVLAFRAVFDWQLYGEPRRLASAVPLMPPFDGSLQLAQREGDDSEQ
ncbi:MAG: transglycosylase SLT domain-containing protein [Ectothiorhodospiraceae bacterium]|nr:transglycosylase SLT domain-containing protein [Ectothiorhodospiraceae bacterium]MCH8504931.1 transglycosylase SLT domain-containing protein [Ectothiorhodospiraceae bacterium]